MLKQLNSLRLIVPSAMLLVQLACSGLSLTGSTDSKLAKEAEGSANAKPKIEQKALKEDAAMLDMSALEYAQKLHLEVAAKLGDSAVSIGRFEFEGMESLYSNLIGGLEVLGDKRTIREQLDDLGLDPELREEPSDETVDTALSTLESDIMTDRLLNLNLAAPAPAPGVAGPNDDQFKEKLQKFGEAFQDYKDKNQDSIYGQKDEEYGVQFSAGCFSLMHSGEACRNRSLYSTLHAFAGSAVFGFCFLNGSQQVSNPGYKPHCMITY